MQKNYVSIKNNYPEIIAIIFFLPDVKPPDAPPNAFPNVEVIISTFPITLQYSIVPLPFLPIKYDPGETGKIKLDNSELQEALIEITKKKISVDNPRYSTYKKLIK